MGDYPLIVVFGLDPVVHEIPPLLYHHLAKMQKDFVIRFLAEEDVQPQMVGDLKKIMEKVAFKPKPKKSIIKP